MPIVKLTKRAIDALVPPKAKQVILWDTEVKGFGLRIMASGIKTFVVQYRNAEGIKRRMNLGRFGVLTVDRARDLAKLKLAEVIVILRSGRSNPQVDYIINKVMKKWANENGFLLD